jgi:hypothetical protein
MCLVNSYFIIGGSYKYSMYSAVKCGRGESGIKYNGEGERERGRETVYSV